MKIQLDLDLKTIKIDENVNIKTFLKIIKELRPNDWAEYTMLANANIVTWYNPIPYWFGHTPPVISYGTNTGDSPATPGVTTSVTNWDPTGPSTLTSNLLNYEILN